jgi:5,10-methylene-tetrahydrofolate dehydrogenase/methenyl tetrahydrofolate cyclohydrolase
MICDGRLMAKEILVRTKMRAEKLSHVPSVVAYVAGEPTSATRSYLNIKKRSADAAGCLFEETKDTDSFREADAAIVQLPLPSGFDTAEILNSIPVEKDADVLSQLSLIHI